MFDSISTYLEANATPEQKQVCLAGCQALVDVGITEHVDILTDEINAIDSTGFGTGDLMIGIINGLLIPMHRNALGEFGIVLADDITLAMASDILSGVAQISNYGDRATIVGLCDAVEGSEAALSDILELMGQFNATEYLPALESVSPQLLERIQQLMNEPVTELQPSEDTVRACRARLNSFLALPEAKLTVTQWPAEVTPFPGTFVLHYLNDGGRIGIVSAEILPPYRNALSALPAQQLAAQLLGLILASEVPYDFIFSTARNEIEHVTSELDKITAVMNAVPKLLEKVPNA